MSNRTSQLEAQEPTKKFWQSTNFYFAAIMLIGSFWGLQEQTAQTIIGVGVAGIAAIGGIRQFLQTAKFGGFLDTLKQANTQNYIVSLLAILGIPQAQTLVDSASKIVDAAQQKNYGLLISTVLSFFTILFYTVIKKK